MKEEMKDSEEERGISPVYELQLIVMGMCMAVPGLAKELCEADFCHDEFRLLVKGMKNSETALVTVKEFLSKRGCTERWNRDERAKDVILRTLKSTGRAWRIVRFVTHAADKFEKMDTDDKDYFIEHMERIETLLDAQEQSDA